MYSMTRFSELLKLFPKTSFDKIVKASKADHYVKNFKSWDLLVTMLYGQLTQAKSLRRLVDGFNTHETTHYHLNTKACKRSTISDSLSQRSVEPFKQVCNLLIQQVSRQDRKQCKELISIIDSSPIRLVGHGYEWTEQWKNVKEQGLKLHIGLDSHSNTPNHANITRSNVNDITNAKNNISIEKGVTYVMDKAYLDYNWWHEINQKGAYFVSRIKSNTSYKVVDELHVTDTHKVIRDQVIQFKNKRPGGKRINKYHGQNLRLVTVTREDKTPMAVITNDFNRSASEIAQLYKGRWQIELFFKWVKQKLKLKRFFGHSENAVKLQIYSALIAFLLMRKLKQISNNWSSMLELQTWLQHGLFVRD
jgi:putative transposase